MSALIKIIKPSGILDSIQARQVRQEINSSLVSGQRLILVNMQAVTLIDSSALGELVVSLKAVRAVNGRLCMCSIGEQPRMVFELTGMEKVFEVFHTQEEFERGLITVET